MGSDAVFPCVASGYPVPEIKWSKVTIELMYITPTWLESLQRGFLKKTIPCLFNSWTLSFRPSVSSRTISWRFLRWRTRTPGPTSAPLQTNRAKWRRLPHSKFMVGVLIGWWMIGSIHDVNQLEHSVLLQSEWCRTLHRNRCHISRCPPSKTPTSPSASRSTLDLIMLTVRKTRKII